MPLKALLVSDRERDHQFCQGVATRLGMGIAVSTTAPYIRSFLIENSSAVVFVDGDRERSVGAASFRSIAQAVSQHVPPERVVVLADEQISSQSTLVEMTFFGHFFLRRFDYPLTAEMIDRIVLAGVNAGDSKLRNEALTKGGTLKALVIEDIGQKNAAVSAIQQTLIKRGLADRLAANLAIATDELLLSAMANGTGQRMKATVQLSSHDDFFSISVRDQLGALNRRDVQSILKKDYQKTEYVPENDARVGGGLGTYYMLLGGMSLLFAVNQGVETETFVFFPKTVSFKEFRSAFQFFSFLMPA